MNSQTLRKNRIEQNPRDHRFVQNPYALYEKLHAQGLPVFWEDYGFWCLSSFAAVNAALRDRRFARLPPPSHARPAIAPHLRDFAAVERYSLLAMEPPEHTRLRKAVNRAFLSRQVERMTPEITALAHRCIDDFESDDRAEILSQYATPIPVAVITRLLGVAQGAGEQLIKWSHAMVRVYTLTQSYDDEIAANTAAREFQDFIKGVISVKRQQSADDLISHLLTKQQGEQALSDDEIVSVVILLLNAGHEATVHQLGNAIRTLLNHYAGANRATLLAILANNEKTDALVTECMRYDAPLHLFTRYAQQRITLDCGLVLEPGEQVGLLLAAANRCPIRFAHANRFAPERGDGGHLSLGAGLHFCVGAPLAKLELRIALQVLFQRLPALNLEAPVTYQDAFHFHGLENVPVRW